MFIAMSLPSTSSRSAVRLDRSLELQVAALARRWGVDKTPGSDFLCMNFAHLVFG